MSAPPDKEIWAAYIKGVKRAKSAGSKSKRHPGESRDPDKLSNKKDRRNSFSLSVPVISTARSAGDSVWIPAFAGMTPKKKPPLINLDRKTERAMRGGSLKIDAKLDLHGMTQAVAYVALEKFMAAQIKRGHRNLLVITGKGSSGPGVLRANLPQWLESLPAASAILSLRTAALKHGGDGAFYIILKRRRD